MHHKKSSNEDGNKGEDECGWTGLPIDIAPLSLTVDSDCAF